MALSCKQHKILPLQMEKIVLRQAEELKNQKISLRAGKGKRQVVTYGGVSWWQTGGIVGQTVADFGLGKTAARML